MSVLKIRACSLVWCGAGVAATCLLLCSCGGEKPARNVVFLSIDTLRADHLGCYGYHRNTTPRIDELAARGVRFETVITAIDFTFPSHASMLTSLYPPAFDVWENGGARLSDSVVTLAEVLKGRGYSTGAFVGSFMLDSRFGLDQGCETYDDEMESGLTWKVGVTNANRVQTWKILDGYADGKSYDIEIQHAMRGSLGGFNFVAWSDEDGDGLPDTLIGRSGRCEKPALEWSRWTFATDAKRIFVGYEMDSDAETFTQRVTEVPPGYEGLGTTVYCAPNPGDVPVNKADGYLTNIRVTLSTAEGGTRTFGTTDVLLPRRTRHYKGHEFLDLERRAEEVNRAATAWLKSHSDGPFFLFLHYFDPHTPYEPPGNYADLFTDPDYCTEDPAFLEGRWLRNLNREDHREKPLPAEADRDHMIGLYDGEIAYADAQFGVLLDTLSELGLTENTFVVVTADHGEYMTEHGWCFGHWYRDLYDPVLKVPLVVAGPGVPSGKVVGCPVQLVDIAPTVLQLLNEKRAPTFMGESLLGLMRGEKSLARSECYVFHSDVSCLWTPEWKFVLYHPTHHGEVEYPENRLHYLPDDPQENVNLIASRRELAMKYAGKIMQFREASAQVSATPTQLKIDEESRRKLKALGYL